MKNILIIGCGLLGSSLLRRINKKKLAQKIFIYEKSKKNIQRIKKLIFIFIGTGNYRNPIKIRISKGFLYLQAYTF